MNKKVIYVSVGVAIAAAAAYIVYRKYKRPSVEEIQVDWENERASFYVNGKQTDVSKDMSTMIGNGYSLSWYRSAGDGTSVTAVVLKKDNAIVEYVSEKPVQ